MSLTTDQEIHALYEKFVNAPGPEPVAAVLKFWAPDLAQAQAVALSIVGVNAIDFAPWTQDARGNTVKASPNPFPKLPPATTRDQWLAYAGLGYAPDGAQKLFTQTAFDQARKKCDEVFKAATFEAAEAALVGSGYMTVEAANECVMIGLWTPAGLGGSPHVGIAGATTLEAVVEAYLKQRPPAVPPHVA